MGTLLVNLILGLDYRNGCIKGYRSATKILYADSESPQKSSLDTSQTIPNGAGCISQFCATITDLAILGATMGISNFPVQILNLLKKQVQIQVESSKMEPVIFPDFSQLSP